MERKPWYYVGARVLVALFSVLILASALISVKGNHDGEKAVIAVENRDQPNLLLGAIALYLLGVATDFDLALPLRLLHSNLPTKQSPTERDDQKS